RGTSQLDPRGERRPARGRAAGSRLPRTRPPVATSTREAMSERRIRPTPRRLTGSVPRARRPGWRDHVGSLAKATPARLALGVFTLLIGLFTALLALPVSSADGQGTALIDALFTAVSAICV